MSKPTLNPVLKSFWKTKADIKVLKGGRASSKTWDIAGVAISLASTYTLKFLCMRQFQTKIQESVYAILIIQIERFGLTDEFDIQKSAIVHKVTGSSFHFYGIHRNIAEIKGFEGADICWIEEGEGLTKSQWEIIEPTLRKEGAEAWISFNPKFVNDFVIKNFKHDPDNGIIVRHINYDENPFISDTMRRKIERLKIQDIEDYEHIYLGIPLTDDDKAIIKRSWIEAAINAHEKLGIEVSGSHRIGYDIADDGDDKCATVEVYGILATYTDEWKAQEDELNKSATKVFRMAQKNNALVNYDSIGVGASTGSTFNELNKNSQLKVKHNKFNAGAKVENPERLYDSISKIKNKDMFSNLKAQTWWRVASRFKATYNAVTKGEKFNPDEIISISKDIPKLEQLKEELSAPHKHYDESGKVKVESKKDLRKREVPSPNIADAFIMAYAYNHEMNKKKEFKVQTPGSVSMPMSR